MKLVRLFLICAMAAPLCVRAASTDDEEGWKAFGHALNLAQILMRIAAQSEDPNKGFDDVLAGRSTEANRAIAGMLEEATADMPPQYRSRVASIGQDIASLARKQIAAAPAAGSARAPVSADRALQARKDLTAMGLRYYDEGQFLDAVKRNDQLATELFIAGRGVNLDARTWSGRSALDIARDNGNTQLAELLARNLPAKR